MITFTEDKILKNIKEFELQTFKNELDHENLPKTALFECKCIDRVKRTSSKSFFFLKF